MAKPGNLFVYAKGAGDLYTEEWIMCLGRIALNFAQLEGCAIWLIDSIGTKSEKDSVRAKQSFVHRNELARLLVPYKELPDDLADDWTQLLSELSSAAGRRNDIFHNPFSAPHQTPFQKDDGIILLKKGEHVVLGLGDIQDYQAVLIALSERMHDLLEATRQHVAASGKGGSC